MTFWLLLIVISGQLKLIVKGDHAAAQCVQLGQANNNIWHDHAWGDPVMNDDYTTYYRHGYWTIGARKFDVKYNFLDLSDAWRQGVNTVDRSEPDYTGFNVDGDFGRKRRKRSVMIGPQEDLRDLDPIINFDDDNSTQLQRMKRADPRPDNFVLDPNDNTACPYEFKPIRHPSVDYCPADTQVQIRTYAVKEEWNGGSRILNGWLYFEVELTDKEDQILAVYVQVRDEYFNAIGEFVSDPNWQCNVGPRSSDFAQPTPYQVLPCSAVGFREAKVSNALFMARKQALRNQSDYMDRFLPDDDLMKHGIRFTWRLSEYWCNRHLRIRPEAIIFTKKMAFKNNRYAKPYILRKAAKYWLKHKWYGSADIKKENTNLSCSDQVVDYSTGKMERRKDNVSLLVAPWLQDDTVLSILENDYMYTLQYEEDASGKWQFKQCHANPRVTILLPKDTPNQPPPEKSKDIVPTFSGRCTHHFRKDPSHEALQGCNLNEKGEEFQDLIAQYPNIQKYSTFVHDLTFNRTQLCTVPCHPPTLANLSEILRYTDRTGESNFTSFTTYHKGERLKRKYEQFYVGRKYHAFLCIYWTMFFMPVGIFIARYLKETFMNISCIGGHLWFWVHLATSVAALFLCVSSLTGLSQTLDTWGRSLQGYGIAHRYVGYTSIVLFLAMLVIGGFRGLHMQMRYVMMTCHSIIGFLIYFLNLIALILSAYIPASPAMGNNCLSDGTPTEGGSVVIVISIWIVMDGVLHAAMNILQCMTDQAHGVRRRWWCPIIPILPADAHEDMVGSVFRKMTMLAYGIASFIMANTAAGLVWAHTPENETCLELTGPSTCNEPWGCSSSAKGYIKQVLGKVMNTTGQYIFLDW